MRNGYYYFESFDELLKVIDDTMYFWYKGIWILCDIDSSSPYWEEEGLDYLMEL